MPSDRENEKDRKLFIGGLDYETSDESLREHFEQYGELTDYVVMRFPDTRRSRGFGFVTFREVEMLEECLAGQPHSLDGKQVELKRATPRTENRSGGGRGGDRGYGGGRGGRSEQEEDYDPEGKSMRKLFIGGLNYSTTEEELRAHFEQFGELVDCVVMKFNDTGRSRGFGFVTYSSAAQLDACQDARPHEIAGKVLETKRATPRSDAGKPEAQASVKKIFIGGVSDDIEDEDLRDYFDQFGRVMNVEQMKWNDTGKKRGFGFVEFDDYDAVDKIVLVGRHHLKNRRLEVKKALSKQEMSMLKGRQEDVWAGNAGGRGGGGGGGRMNQGGNGSMMNQGGNRGMGNNGGGMSNMGMGMNNMMGMGGNMNMMSNMMGMGGMGGGMGMGMNNMMGNMGGGMNNMMGMGGGMGMMGNMGGGMNNMGMGGNMGGGMGGGNMRGNMRGNSVGNDDMPVKQEKGYSTGSGSSSSMGGGMNSGMGGGMNSGMGGMMGGMGGGGNMSGGMGGMMGGMGGGNMMGGTGGSGGTWSSGGGRSGGGAMRGPGGNQSSRDNNVPYNRPERGRRF